MYTGIYCYSKGDYKYSNPKHLTAAFMEMDFPEFYNIFTVRN